jgi:acetyltransferase-like isoleucine patch superfamily enzyme
MKALQSIGIAKAVRFVWYSIVSKILHCVILPQTRGFLMRACGATIGADSIIGNISFANLYHYGFSRIIIGNKVFVGDEASLDCRGGITIEDNVTVSNRTQIVTHINVGYADHPLQKDYPTQEGRVIMKNGSYIGTGAIILPGITIGREAVVGAGAVVTHDVSARIVVAGVPAKKIKKL